MTFDELAQFSAFPLVQLDTKSLPVDGFLLGLSPSCLANLRRNSPHCLKHYQDLASGYVEQFVQCPFGFTTMPGKAGNFRFAITGLVGFPRFHTADETKIAKQNPQYRVDREAMTKASSALMSVATRMQAIELGEVKQYSMALHEIRKLNREVKQTAERICRLMSPDDPDNADPELVKIMKTSELMSHQFDVIEILANETLATLPLNSTSEIYKIFDKCARIYRSERRRIMLEAPPNYHARVKVCDKTFPIIPSVLIENALKYSADLEVRISIQPGGQDKVIVAVSNLARLKAPLTEAVFMRGYRASQDSEGSGNGLYVAQLVARQHSTMLRVETLPAHANLTRVTLRAIFHALEH